MKNLLIDGDWLVADQASPNINPSNTNDRIDDYAVASAAHAEQAVAAAKRALPAWRNMGIQDRSDILDRVGTTILSRKIELGTLLAREEGKTLPEGIGEAARAGYIFKFFAGEVLRQAGEQIDSVRPGVEVTVTREPVGVVGIITPWNFPIAIPAWKIAPALAYGNCVVFKPAELTPGCAHALMEILNECGLPAGVCNLVMGEGRTVGQAIVSHHDVDAVSFTGSVPTGRAIAQQAVARGAKIQLEMGGKNPLIVAEDADLDIAVDCAIQGAFFSTGQRCTASSRLIVVDEVHDAFVDAMVAKMKTLVVGDACDKATHIGPVVDAAQLEKVQSYVNIGKQEGAELIWGGELVDYRTPGFFMAPALFINTTPEMRVNREEIFGPVATVLKVADFDTAMAEANNTEFGLSAGIVTQSLRYATRFRKEIEAGMTMVNLPTAGVDYHVPFGGSKESSYGSREQGRYASEFYTRVKTSYLLP